MSNIPHNALLCKLWIVQDVVKASPWGEVASRSDDGEGFAKKA